MNSVTVRPLRREDSDGVAACGFAAWMSGDIFNANIFTPADIERVQFAFGSFAERDDANILVAEIGNSIAGWSAREGGGDYVSDLWVDPDYQRRGVGTRLLAATGAAIADAGFEQMRLDTHAANGRGIAFYLASGFRITGRVVEFADSLQRDVEKVRLELPLDGVPFALMLLAAGDLAIGAEWERAHEICQAREGEKAFDRAHALCHRIEGDDWNAGYWYRRAETQSFAGTIAEEWDALRREIAEE